VMQFKARLDRAEKAEISLLAAGMNHFTYLDLRHRTAHASGGLIREVGSVGNLPSGEAYIVPYEGEKAGDSSQSEGVLPVQFGNEIVLYRLKGNRAIEVLSAGESSEAERRKLQEEPAYGNIAELGLGVLGEWGITAMGSILLDEKLGLHIAFGRSEHFGGVTSPASFRDPSKVVHIDRVYVPSSQPMIVVKEVTLVYDGGVKEVIMADGTYRV
jgi:leucyl aminopeptidase (aminopeptidase T)